MHLKPSSFGSVTSLCMVVSADHRCADGVNRRLPQRAAYIVISRNVSRHVHLCLCLDAHPLINCHYLIAQIAV